VWLNFGISSHLEIIQRNKLQTGKVQVTTSGTQEVAIDETRKRFRAVRLPQPQDHRGARVSDDVIPLLAERCGGIKLAMRPAGDTSLKRLKCLMIAAIKAEP